MFKRPFFKPVQRSRHQLRPASGLILITLACLTPLLSGCEQLESLDENDTRRDGVMPLDSVKLGAPESVFKQSPVTFEKDLKPEASAGNKTQYLSHALTPAGGQYLVDCSDGNCNRIQIVYLHAIPKDAALSLAKNLLPKDAPPLSRVDDSALKNPGSKEFVENYFYSEDYLIELDYSDNKSNQVKRIMALQLSPEQSSALRLQGAAESKNNGSAQNKDKNPEGQKSPAAGQMNATRGQPNATTVQMNTATGQMNTAAGQRH